MRQATFDWLRGDPSPNRPLGTRLPVDGYWEDLALVVEFQEEQHYEPSPFFDRRQTVSGVGRGEQRRLYDARKRELVPANGLKLVVIAKSEFVLKSKRIVRERARDIDLVGAHLAVLTRIVVDVGETSVVELELSRFPRVHGGLSCPTLRPG